MPDAQLPGGRPACIIAHLLDCRRASDPSEGDLAEHKEHCPLPIGRQRLPQGRSRLSKLAHGVIPASEPAREALLARAWAPYPALSNSQRQLVWSIENGQHRVLDVASGEDRSRLRERCAARNFAVSRRIALDPLRADVPLKASLKGRRKTAAWDGAYMARLLRG